VNDDSWNERLREQRTALGFSQEQAGKAAGVSREMWSRYESGRATVGMDVLQRIAAVGFDVLYVLTGQSPLRAAEPSPPAISRRGRTLLENYLACDEDGQKAIERMATLEAQSKSLKKAG
jgi:transcriptional regulator with XRE-family HTH domain